MPKRFLASLPNEVITSRAIDLRQGLNGVPVALTGSALLLTNSGSSGVSMALAPDQSGMVMAAQSSTAGSNFRYVADPANFLSATAPAVTFSGTIYCCACSNTHYAVGGTSPFLYVYDKSTHAVQSVATTGLGQVNALDFSPDGTKLVIGHATSPFLRVYNVADWTYTDVAGGILPGSSVQAVRYTADGSSVVTQSNGSPYLCAYAPALTSRTFSSTNAAYSAPAAASRGGATMVRSPLTSTVTLFSITGGFLAQLDASGSGTVSTFANVSGTSSSYGAVVADPDLTEDAVYVNHASGTSGRTWTKWKLSDRTAYGTQPNWFRQFGYGNGSTPYSAAVIMATTPYNITGTVRDVSNNPVARVVRAFDRATGELMAQTTSDGGTGNYTLKLWSAGPYDVQFMAASGELLNDILYAKAEPAAG